MNLSLKLSLSTILLLSSIALAAYSGDLEAVLNGTNLPVIRGISLVQYFQLYPRLPCQSTVFGSHHSFSLHQRFTGITNMVQTAASNGNWGDYLYLYHAFSYSGLGTNTLLASGTEIYSALNSEVYDMGGGEYVGRTGC